MDFLINCCTAILLIIGTLSSSILMLSLIYFTIARLIYEFNNRK